MAKTAQKASALSAQKPIEQYEHKDKQRVNNPPVGLVDSRTDNGGFQQFVNKRDVKDDKDEDLTAEPKMVKAFRDTWEPGIHFFL